MPHSKGTKILCLPIYDPPIISSIAPGASSTCASTHKVKDGTPHLHAHSKRDEDTTCTDVCILDVTVPVACVDRLTSTHELTSDWERSCTLDEERNCLEEIAGDKELTEEEYELLLCSVILKISE